MYLKYCPTLLHTIFIPMHKIINFQIKKECDTCVTIWVKKRLVGYKKNQCEQLHNNSTKNECHWPESPAVFSRSVSHHSFVCPFDALETHVRVYTGQHYNILWYRIILQSYRSRHCTGAYYYQRVTRKESRALRIAIKHSN